MGNQCEEDLPVSIYKSSGCFLEIRLFYVRIASCAVNAVPDHLILRHLRREIGVSLEINGSRIPPSDTVSVTLRRDRVDKGSSEVTYVSTDNVRVSGPVEFEVNEEKEGLNELILCGTWDNNRNGTGWSMDCYNAASFGSVGSVFSHSSIEVYVAGCSSGVPWILTKTIQVSPRRKLSRHGMLDAIPENENGFISQQKLPITDSELDDYDSEGKDGHGFYSEDMYFGEDGKLSWFNAGVRVGVGIGLGMCVGVGIGVGLLMRSYQATTSNLRRRFF
ncbi:hypothetical protein RND71_040784 [Anisodus tanguticus]|uniref:Erythronate-4-phosphate dehydrogenase family protein n=1 Tax=Anisodus tanguticus TaxID=243964 RepID=A0AAE1UQK1_9SOLA|nr:hypothetical protein RND71_040784 [Anisodus tanguticus]